jgi:hypothetical protein
VVGDDVPGDVLKLGEDSLNLMTKLVSNMYETEDLPKDFIEVTVIVVRSKKPQNAATAAQSASSQAQRR